MKVLTILFLSSSLMMSCSHKAASSRVAEKGIADEALEGSPSLALQFDKGKTSLSPGNKKLLNEFARKVSRPGREISEIKVLAWSDSEYPGKGDDWNTKNVELAKKRAKTVRKFIRDDLHSKEQIDIFNMAKRPSPLDQVTRDEEFRVKQDVARTGVSATRLPSGELSYTKAGKVLVIIDYREVKP